MNDAVVLSTIMSHLLEGGTLMLFLDYDGTLVPIAPTPDQARPDSSLLKLMSDLGRSPVIQTVIISGRPLSFLREILPVPGLILAGLYGAELFRDGGVIYRGATLDECRPTITWVASQWMQLIKERSGFLVEDKGSAVALHARWAESIEAKMVLATAQVIANDTLRLSRQFQLLGGHRFLEVAPLAADKARAVDWFLSNQPMTRSLPVYFGDDDKDEKAFLRVTKAGGVSVGVGTRYELADATVRVDSPDVVRNWLHKIAGQAQVLGQDG